MQHHGIPPTPPPPPPSNFPPTPPPPPNSGMASNVHPASGGMYGPVAARGTLVDVRVSCRDLILPEGLEPSTFTVVYSQTAGKSDWSEVTRSETVMHSSTPEYRRIFQMEYRFELYQQMRIVVFHRNTQSDSLKQQTLLGVADCTLGSIVSVRGSVLELPLVNVEAVGTSNGIAILSAEEIISAKKMVTMQISIANLMTPDVRVAQQSHLDSLRARANAPIEHPTLQKRGTAALFGRFRKDDRKPAALPAHLANQVHTQEHERTVVQQEIAAVQAQQAAPPPFVPFVTILRAPREASAAVDFRSPDIPWDEVYKSFQIQNYADTHDGFALEPFTLSEYDLTEGEQNRFLKLAVVQVRAGTPGAIVGEHITTFPALRRACLNQENTILSLDPIGQLTIHKYEEKMQPSFIDYLRGGWCDFGLICAVDFTSSNGDPRQPGSRHYMMSSKPNEYEAAMRTVANMLSSYSSDTRIPAYGFGANLPPKYNVSHCFPISEHELGDPFCNGVEGLIHAYKATLNRIQLFGPTMFSEVLRTVNVFVSRRTEAAFKAGNTTLAYTVLLILTDGAISDYNATLDELIRLSRLPLSVVIIGIGNEDFGRMKSLDSSKGILRRGTDLAAREFIQFVPYQEFQGNLSHLAEKVLGGIPDQVISYIEKVQGKSAPQN